MDASKTDALQRLSANGVSVWLDDLSRELLAGDLDDLIEDYAVVGVTTNPTTFASALAQGDRYDEQLKHLAWEGASVQEAVFRITTDDVRTACDRFRSVYEATDRANGRVSIEVDPGLAHDTQGTVEQARRLWEAIDRDNLLVKVPATPEGIRRVQAVSATSRMNWSSLSQGVAHSSVLRGRVFNRSCMCWISASLIWLKSVPLG